MRKFYLYTLSGKKALFLSMTQYSEDIKEKISQMYLYKKIKFSFGKRCILRE